MRKHLNPSLAISLLALILATTPLADAARRAVGHALAPVRVHGHRLSARPYANGLLLLGKNREVTAAAIPTVKNSDEVDGMNVDALSSCPGPTVDLGTWCLDTSPYPLTNAQVGENNWFWASQKCVEQGGFLPSA